MSKALEVLMDDHGQLVLPAALSGRLGLIPGITLLVEEADQGDLRLRVPSESPVLVDKDGILVVRAESSDDLSDITRRERDYRLSVSPMC